MTLRYERLDAPIEVYAVAGCSSCLRLKEFLEESGLEYQVVDPATDPAGAAKLRRLGTGPPAVAVGDRWARGVRLADVAELLGIDYVPRVILPTSELRDRYCTVIATLCRLMAQADDQALRHQRPGRERTLLSTGYHAASVMRVFLRAYDPDGYQGDPYESTLECPVPEDVQDSEGVIARAHDTLELFERWWDRDGRDDPLEEVIEMPSGHHTALEGLEREVWHSAHHTRQVAMLLEECGIPPDRPLGDAELAGLPLPDRAFA